MDGAVWRESAVLLAATTALLYLTSQVYGGSYLSFFGVRGYFEGWGLGNLALVSIPGIVGIAASTLLVHAILNSAKHATAYYVGVAFVVVVGSIRAVAKLNAPDTIRFSDLSPIIIGLTAWFAANYWRGDAVARIGKLEKGAVNARNQLDQMPDADSPVKRLMERTHAYLSRRVWELRVRVWLLVGYVCMLTVVPSVAWIHAMGTANQEYAQFHPLSPGSPARLPVYWVGDRAVFVTFEPVALRGVPFGTSCQVHVQMDGIEQTRFTCPDQVVAAIR